VIVKNSSPEHEFQILETIYVLWAKKTSHWTLGCDGAVMESWKNNLEFGIERYEAVIE